jgi:hypothetical protein
MDLGKRSTGDASEEGRSMRCRLTGVRSSSGGGHRRGLPLAVSLEPTQPSDAALATAAETLDVPNEGAWRCVVILDAPMDVLH